MNRRKPNIDRLSSSSLALLVAVAALLQLTGCRSDPYCNQAIANYRAEVQTLQDEYYFLKARYEADMAKAGQPIPQISPLGAGQSSLDSIVDGQYYGEVVQGNTVYSTDGTYIEGAIQTEPYLQSQPYLQSAPEILPTPVADPPAGSNGGTPSGDPSSYIRKLEVDQLQARRGEAARLLIRPLDDRGDILPIEGDIKIRILNGRMQTAFEQEYSNQMVAKWIEDRPGQAIGIHLPIQSSRSLPTGKLLCDIQYRTSDNRILKERANLWISDGSQSSGGVIRSVTQPAPSAQPRTTRPAQPARNTSSPTVLSEDDMQGEIDIQIGDELNFDSLNESGEVQPPTWSPDR